MAEFSLKLRYFRAVRSRGESIRMLLKHSKIPFEDITLTGPEFMEMRPTLPTGKLPILEVNGRYYPESGSLLRFLGQIAALTPTDPIQFLSADAAYEVARGLSVIDPIVNRLGGDVLTEEYTNYFNLLPAKLKFLSETLSDQKFFGGEDPCYADFGIWHYLDNTETVKPESVQQENLKAWMERLASLEEVKKYLAQRPEILEGRRSLIEKLQEM